MLYSSKLLLFKNVNKLQTRMNTIKVGLLTIPIIFSFLHFTLLQELSLWSFCLSEVLFFVVVPGYYRLLSILYSPIFPVVFKAASLSAALP